MFNQRLRIARRVLHMVLWCKTCNALLGLREPLWNWSTDRTGLCSECLEKQYEFKKLDPNNDTDENTPLSIDQASPAV
jgi:hypothetical protein